MWVTNLCNGLAFLLSGPLDCELSNSKKKLFPSCFTYLLISFWDRAPPRATGVKLSRRLHGKIPEQQETALDAVVKAARDAAQLQELRYGVQLQHDEINQMQERVRLLTMSSCRGEQLEANGESNAFKEL